MIGLGALHLRGARGIGLKSLTPFLAVDHLLGNSVGAIEWLLAAFHVLRAGRF